MNSGNIHIPPEAPPRPVAILLPGTGSCTDIPAWNTFTVNIQGRQKTESWLCPQNGTNLWTLDRKIVDSEDTSK